MFIHTDEKNTKMYCWPSFIIAKKYTRMNLTSIQTPNRSWRDIASSEHACIRTRYSNPYMSRNVYSSSEQHMHKHQQHHTRPPHTLRARTRQDTHAQHAHAQAALGLATDAGDIALVLQAAGCRRAQGCTAGGEASQGGAWAGQEAWPPRRPGRLRGA